MLYHVQFNTSQIALEVSIFYHMDISGLVSYQMEMPKSTAIYRENSS